MINSFLIYNSIFSRIVILLTILLSLSASSYAEKPFSYQSLEEALSLSIDMKEHGLYHKEKKVLMSLLMTNELPDSVEFIVRSNLAIACKELGLYDSCLLFQKQAVELAFSVEKETWLPKLYGEISDTYRLARQYPDAHKYNNLCKKVALKQKDSVAWVQGLTNDAILFKEEGKYDRALGEFYLAEKFVFYLQDAESQFFFYNNWGKAFFKTKMYHEALNTFHKSYDCLRDGKNPSLLVSYFTNVGETYIYLNNYDEADRVLKKALSITKEHGLKGKRSNVLKLLTDLYEHRGEYKEANKYLHAYLTANDELQEHLMQKEFLRLQADMDFDQKEHENILLQHKIDLQNQELQYSGTVNKKQRHVLFAGVIILLLAFVVILIVYRYYKLKAKDHYKLSLLHETVKIQKTEIVKQAEALEVTNEEIISINKNLEGIILKRTLQIKKHTNQLLHMAFVNAHEIRGPLARVLGLIKLLQLPLSDEEKVFIVEKLNVHGEELDEVTRKANKFLEGKIDESEAHLKNEVYSDEE